MVPLVHRRLVCHRTREVEGADEDIAFAAHRVRRLRAKAASFYSKRMCFFERTLRQGIDRAARITQGTVDAIRTLHNDREIRLDFPRRLSFLHRGQAEYQQ
jgi:hypothetical protein